LGTLVSQQGPLRDLHEKNRLAWNLATDAHNSHKGDQAAFYREGGNKLFAEERELLGDLAGKRVVHLQCNAGQDTLSLAQMGADVVGVDISDTAIEFARNLSRESGVAAEFVRADIFDWLSEASARGEQFDVAFSSYGAVIWLSNLKTWAEGIGAILRPGGRFVVVDFHPVSLALDDDWTLRFPYSSFDSRPEYVAWDEGVGDYVAMEMKQANPGAEVPGVKDFVNPHPSYEFAWGMADIIGSLIRAGLRLTDFREYPHSNSGHIPGMRLNEQGEWIPPDGVPALPMMYGIVAEKP
jgi:SAM-dependent methyltransferase